MSSALDVIAAIATPPGQGAIGIIRVSGLGAWGLVAARLRTPGREPFPLADIRPRYLYLAWLMGADDEPRDQVQAVFYPAGKSYTGEEMVEIFGHGGDIVLGLLLQALLTAGARLAGPGEFSRRAFLNGKLDLAQAEAVAGLIAAESEVEVKLALAQMRGDLSQWLGETRAQLLSVIARLEGELEFVEDVEFQSRHELLSAIADITGRLQEVIELAQRGCMLARGVRVVLTGAPNVGKSSLFNALLREGRAIVHPEAGTTRDVLEGTLILSGARFILYDTAGIHAATGEIEGIGIARAEALIAQADLVIRVVDGLGPCVSWQPTADRPHEILVINKRDLGSPWAARFLEVEFRSKIFWVSATQRLGLEPLERYLVQWALGNGHFNVHNYVLKNVRHIEHCRIALVALQRTAAGLVGGAKLDLICHDLREAVDSLGLITGAVTTEDVLGEIFGRFCIGK